MDIRERSECVAPGPRPQAREWIPRSMIGVEPPRWQGARRAPAPRMRFEEASPPAGMDRRREPPSDPFAGPKPHAALLRVRFRPTLLVEYSISVAFAY
jgi:hypothetical protein